MVFNREIEVRVARPRDVALDAIGRVNNRFGKGREPATDAQNVAALKKFARAKLEK